MIRRIYNKIKTVFSFPTKKYDTTGERVDINYNDKIDFETLDMYQKSHYRRYEYAVKNVGQNEDCGDFACGTGYGSVMLSQKVNKVIGADINSEVVSAITKRYNKRNKVQFLEANLLHLNFESTFDTIVSFETIEHFTESNIELLLKVFHKAIKKNGKLIFSTPYMQENTEAALNMGHHLTFFINEQKIEQWLTGAGFIVESFMYQNYETHTLLAEIDKKDFIICKAQKR